MKISIITACYNSEKTIKDTISSVKNQTYSNIEHIFVDGLSSDNTIEIIKDNHLTNYTSEKDNGIYDAMNKGLARATGDVIAILNADDFYFDNNVIKDIINAFQTENADIVYSDIVFVDQNNSNLVKRIWKAKKGKLKYGWAPPHPGVFIKRSVYEKWGNFDDSYKVASDIDILVRILKDQSLKTFYLKRYTVKMRLGGISTKSPKHVFKQYFEAANVYKKNGYRFSKIIAFIKIIRKLNQLKKGHRL